MVQSFIKTLSKLARKMNLNRYYNRVRQLKDNTVNERFNRTLQEEFIAFGNYTNDIDKFNEMLTEWLIEYNSFRPHETLGDRTPLEAIESLIGVSTRWSSCTKA